MNFQPVDIFPFKFEGRGLYLKDFHGNEDSTLTRNFFELENSRFFVGKIFFEVRSDFKEIFRFLPVPVVLVSTVFALALENPLGEIQVFTIDFKLNR